MSNALDSERYNQELASLSSWEDWSEFEQKWFAPGLWVPKNVDQMEEELERDDQIIDGIEWKPLSVPVDVQPDVWARYLAARLSVFAKLHTVEHNENLTKSDVWGKQCVYDQIYTHSQSLEYCPLCKRPLLLFALNGNRDDS